MAVHIAGERVFLLPVLDGKDVRIDLDIHMAVQRKPAKAKVKYNKGA